MTPPTKPSEDTLRLSPEECVELVVALHQLAARRIVQQWVRELADLLARGANGSGAVVGALTTRGVGLDA